jgi:hypothetical protein
LAPLRADRTSDAVKASGASVTDKTARLRRELGLFGAVSMGLGSPIGTGGFVSVGQALIGLGLVWHAAAAAMQKARA